MDKLVLTPAEAAEMLGVSMPTMYALCRQPDFPCVRLGRKVLIPRDGLRDWLCARSQEKEVE